MIEFAKIFVTCQILTNLLIRYNLPALASPYGGYTKGIEIIQCLILRQLNMLEILSDLK